MWAHSQMDLIVLYIYMDIMSPTNTYWSRFILIIFWVRNYDQEPIQHVENDANILQQVGWNYCSPEVMSVDNQQV